MKRFEGMILRTGLMIFLFMALTISAILAEKKGMTAEAVADMQRVAQVAQFIRMARPLHTWR